MSQPPRVSRGGAIAQRKPSRTLPSRLRPESEPPQDEDEEWSKEEQKALLTMVRLFLKVKWLGLLILKIGALLSGLIAVLPQLLALFDRLSGTPLR